MLPAFFTTRRSWTETLLTIHCFRLKVEKKYFQITCSTSLWDKNSFCSTALTYDCELNKKKAVNV